ncbi:hypothetical protein D3C73_1591520 [compost metagenome]
MFWDAVKFDDVSFCAFTDGHNPVTVFTGILTFFMINIAVYGFVILWETEVNEVMYGDNTFDFCCLQTYGNFLA